MWLITGCSTGFDVTARKVAQLDGFAAKYVDRARMCTLDVTQRAKIDAVVRAAGALRAAHE